MVLESLITTLFTPFLTGLWHLLREHVVLRTLFLLVDILEVTERELLVP